MSMTEIIEKMKETAEKRYKGICPRCGKEMYICKSIAMFSGINTGTGTCIGCGLFMHIKFNQERQEMDLEPFEKYAETAKAIQDIDHVAARVEKEECDHDE